MSVAGDADADIPIAGVPKCRTIADIPDADVGVASIPKPMFALPMLSLPITDAHISAAQVSHSQLGRRVLQLLLQTLLNSASCVAAADAAGDIVSRPRLGISARIQPPRPVAGRSWPQQLAATGDASRVRLAATIAECWPPARRLELPFAASRALADRRAA